MKCFGRLRFLWKRPGLGFFHFVLEFCYSATYQIMLFECFPVVPPRATVSGGRIPHTARSVQKTRGARRASSASNVKYTHTETNDHYTDEPYWQRSQHKRAHLAGKFAGPSLQLMERFIKSVRVAEFYGTAGYSRTKRSLGQSNELFYLGNQLETHWVKCPATAAPGGGGGDRPYLCFFRNTL